MQKVMNGILDFFHQSAEMGAGQDAPGGVDAVAVAARIGEHLFAFCELVIFVAFLVVGGLNDKTIVGLVDQCEAMGGCEVEEFEAGAHVPDSRLQAARKRARSKLALVSASSLAK